MAAFSPAACAHALPRGAVAVPPRASLSSFEAGRAPHCGRPRRYASYASYVPAAAGHHRSPINAG